MKRISKLVLLLTLLFSACAEKAPELDAQGRLSLPEQGLSLRPPKDWKIVSLPSSKLPLFSTEPKAGARPNILLQWQPGTAADELIGQFYLQQQKQFPQAKLSELTDFADLPGKPRRKSKVFSLVRRNAQDLAVFQQFLLLQRKDGALILTFTCADSVKSELQPIFLDCAGSLRQEM